MMHEGQTAPSPPRVGCSDGTRGFPKSSSLAFFFSILSILHFHDVVAVVQNFAWHELIEWQWKWHSNRTILVIEKSQNGSAHVYP
jgi:hypothetical protein